MPNYWPCEFIVAEVMLREAFKKVKERRKISSASLHRVTGISESHLSEYLNPERNTDMTTEKLSDLVEAMETISPGAKYEFAASLVSENAFAIELAKNIPDMSSDELSVVVLAVSKWLKTSRKKVTSKEKINE